MTMMFARVNPDGIMSMLTGIRASPRHFIQMAIVKMTVDKMMVVKMTGQNGSYIGGQTSGNDSGMQQQGNKWLRYTPPPPPNPN